MSVVSQVRRLEKLAIDNSPALLTAVGVVGTVSTAALTGKASIKAVDILRETERLHETKDPLEKREAVKLVWKLYIPPVATGSLTIAAIVGANHIGSKRAAAVAAAYTISERAFVEYKEKVIEHMGAPKEQKVRDEIAADRIRKNPPSEALVIGTGEVLCYDAFTDRYFNSTIETIKKAQNDTNYQVLHNYYASLSDFYERVGLPATSFSEEVGWNVDKQLEVIFSPILAPDGRPCVAVNFEIAPIRDYNRIH